MERKIIGYVLKDPSYTKEACKGVGYTCFGEAIEDCSFIALKGREEGFAKLALAGKLHKLFKTVYEGDVIHKTGVFSDDYKLPEKWAVKTCKTLIENINKVFSNPITYEGRSVNLHFYLNDKGNWDSEYYIPEGYTEITEEQFKQIIEKELNKKEMDTYKVTRENLQEIHGIACAGWKKKIEIITQETLGAFGTEGELSEETVQSMRDAATEAQRPVIDKLFPKPEIKVVGYISACEVLNIKPLKITDFKHLPEFERTRAFVRHMLVVVRKALVGDWEPDYTNHSQNKYEVYGSHSDTDGFRFIVGSPCCVSVVGSDLTFPSRDLAEYSYKIMEKEYLTYLMNQPYDI